MAKSVPAARLVCIELNPGPTPRGRGKNVPEEKRWQVVFYSKDMKLGPAAVARKVGVNRHTVSAIMDKYKKTRSVHDVKGRGKKRNKLHFFTENLNSEVYQGILKRNLKESKLVYAPKAPNRVIEKWKFLQDGHRAHTAAKTMKFLCKLVGNRLTPHPPLSPDLNPIEDMWSYLDRKVKAANVTNIPQLKRVLNKEWKALPWDEIRKSVDSMPRRLQLLKECGGNRIAY